MVLGSNPTTNDTLNLSGIVGRSTPRGLGTPMESPKGLAMEGSSIIKKKGLRWTVTAMRLRSHSFQKELHQLRGEEGQEWSS